MYYSMWNEKFENIRKDFYRNNGEIKNINRFSFNIDGRRNVESFRIEQLDFLTSLYKNEKDFIDELCKYQGYCMKNIRGNKPITITTLSKKNLKINDIPVIYDDYFINKITSEIRIKKLKRAESKKNLDKKYKESNIILDNTEHLNDFVEYVKSLALNETSRKYLINPRMSLREIPIDDRYILKDTLKDDKVLRNGTLKKGLRSILNEYVNYKSYYDKVKNDGYLTSGLDANLRAINNGLLAHFSNDYHNIREVIIWEDRLRIILEKQLSDAECLNKDNIKSLLNYVNLQKNYRNDKIDKREWLYYQDAFLFDKVEPIYARNRIIKDEKMLELFKLGGIAAVWEGMDADKIYRNEEDAEQLGLIKKMVKNKIKK